MRTLLIALAVSLAGCSGEADTELADLQKTKGEILGRLIRDSVECRAVAAESDHLPSENREFLLSSCIQKVQLQNERNLDTLSLVNERIAKLEVGTSGSKLLTDEEVFGKAE